MYRRRLYLVSNDIVSSQSRSLDRITNMSLNLNKSCFPGPSKLFVYLKNIIGVIQEGKKDLIIGGKWENGHLKRFQGHEELKNNG